MEKIKKIALSSRYSLKACELINFAKTHGFDGIEYTIQSETEEQLIEEIPNIEILAKSKIEIRYHFQFKKVELAHKDWDFAKKSFDYYKKCIDAVNSLGGKHIIVHLCLGYKYQLESMDLNNAKHFLKETVMYAKSKGVTVCLENLTFGLVNTPDKFLDLLNSTGASATIDIGHVVASPIVVNGEITDVKYINALLPYVVSAHIYDKEVTDETLRKATHICPKNKKDIEERIQLLKKGSVDWWLIELGNPDEIIRTLSYIR